MKSAISLLLCASIVSDSQAINISSGKEFFKHDKNHCRASEFGNWKKSEKHGLNQQSNVTKKEPQLLEGYTPEGDMAKKGDNKTQKITLEKKFNPMYEGKDAKSVGANVDLPKELQDKAEEGPPKTPKEASEELFKQEGQGKDMSAEQLEKVQKTNFFNEAPVFQPGQNSQISKILQGDELMKQTYGKKTIEMKPNSNVGLPFQNFVMVYNPNCGHCKEMAPEWVKLAEHVQSTSMGLNVIAINDGSSDVKKKLPGNIGEAEYYPAIYLFKNDKEQSVVEFNPEKESKTQGSAAQSEKYDFKYEGLMKFLTANGVKEPGSTK